MSNPYILSNSQSPALNAIQVKADHSDLQYKMMKSLGANVSKQRREIDLGSVTQGGNSSVSLLKYGLVTNLYLKVVIADSENASADNKKIKWLDGAIPALLRSVVLSSHSRVLEKLDRAQIQNYILEKASGDDSAILSYTGFNTHDNGATATYYIPLPFSFFSLNKCKDALYLQNLQVSITWANATQVNALILTSGTGYSAATAGSVTFNSCHLVQNYLEMDQESNNKLFEQNYSSAGQVVNQLYCDHYRESTYEVSGVTSGSVQTANCAITTKNVVTRSFIMIRNKDLKEVGAGLCAIQKVALVLNGVEYYAVESDACEFERIVMSQHYNKLSVSKAGREDFYKMFVFDYRVIPEIHSSEKFSGGLSCKNTSAPTYQITFTNGDTTNNAMIEIVHEVLNIVQISRADGSMSSVLSV